MNNILVIAGSGGIGAAVVAECLQRYSSAHLYSTYHSSEPEVTDPRVSWFKVDLTTEQDVIDLATKIEKLDALINCAGLLHNESSGPEKTITKFDPEFFSQNIAANTLPSLLLAKLFQRKLRGDTTTHFVSLSARVGSVSDNRIGGWVSYRASKAALNMALKTIAIEWRRTLPNCSVMLFHPGTTDTRLSKPFQKNLPEGQLLAADFVAKALLNLVSQQTPESSGVFLDYAGKPVAW